MPPKPDLSSKKPGKTGNHLLPTDKGLIMDWQKLQSVYDKARQASVSYSLHYSEADDSWFFSVSSAAPLEEWCGKNHSFNVSVDCVVEWLDSVLSGNPSCKTNPARPTTSTKS